MPTHALMTALTLLLASQEAPADHDAQVLASLNARTRDLCETRPRPANETLDTCIQRRTGALLATYGTPKDALTAAGGPPGSPGAGLPGFQTEVIGEANVKEAVAELAPGPRPVTCRQEAVRSQDGTSFSASVVCGNGGESEQGVRETLDDAPSDDD